MGVSQWRLDAIAKKETARKSLETMARVDALSFMSKGTLQPISLRAPKHELDGYFIEAKDYPEEFEAFRALIVAKLEATINEPLPD